MFSTGNKDCPPLNCPLNIFNFGNKKDKTGQVNLKLLNYAKVIFSRTHVPIWQQINNNK